MRVVRFMQGGFLALLLVLDLVVGSFVSTMSTGTVVFVSSLHFLGIVLMSQNDSLLELMAKVFVVSVWLDLNHLASYPVFMFAYVITFLIMYRWRKYVGSNTLEFMVMAILCLFIKEVLMYVALSMFRSYSGSLIGFFTYRSFWVIAGNMIFVPLVVWLHKQMHRIILQRAQNMYMR